MNPEPFRTCGLVSLASAALLASSISLAQEPVISSPLDPRLYFGAGIAQLSLDNDHPSIGGKSATGPYFLGGVQIFERLSFELSAARTGISVGPTCDPSQPQICQLIYYPANSAEYFNLLMGIRLGFPLKNYPNLQPWIATGLAYHYYSWDTFRYFVDGSAPFFGAGLDIRVGERWNIQLEVNHTHYDSADNYGGAGFSSSATQYDAALVYSFR